MSGFLGEVASIATTLFGGSGVSIGNVVLQSFEVPERVTFGGDQAMAVHKFPGGQRVIDVMGRDDHPIEWTGMMLGADAAYRARQLDELRIAGEPVPLAFGDFAYEVVIQRFEAEYRRVNWIGQYRISCVVLTDQAPGGAPTLLGQITDDISAATGIDVAATLTAADAALSTLQTAVAPITALVAGGANVPGVASAVAQAQGIVSGLQATAEGNMGGLIQISASTGAIGGATGLANALTASEALAKLPAIGAYLGRAAVNLSGALP